MLASCPASILNHFPTSLGIPFRFGINSSRSSSKKDLFASLVTCAITDRILSHGIRVDGSCRFALPCLAFLRKS
jgi:hypothetical protein